MDIIERLDYTIDKANLQIENLKILKKQKAIVLQLSALRSELTALREELDELKKQIEDEKQNRNISNMQANEIIWEFQTVLWNILNAHEKGNLDKHIPAMKQALGLVMMFQSESIDSIVKAVYKRREEHLKVIKERDELQKKLELIGNVTIWRQNEFDMSMSWYTDKVDNIPEVKKILKGD